MKYLEDATRNYLYPILISIIILSFLLRVYNLGEKGFWSNEIFSVLISEKNITGIIEESLKVDVHPPLYYITLHYWIKLFGNSEFSIRFLSLIPSVISTFVIYRIGRLIFNNEVGIISAFLFSISYFSIIYAQEARSYSFIILLVLLSNYYLISIIKEEREGIKERRKDLIHISGYLIPTIILLYIHYYGIFFVIAQNIYYILIYRKNIRLWVTMQGILLLSYSIWIPELIGKSVKNVNHPDKPTINTLYDTFRSFAGSDIGLYLIISIIGIIFIIYIVRIYNKTGSKNIKNIHVLKVDISKDIIFLIIWIFIPILITFTISQIFPIYRSKYVIASLPAFILLTSRAIFEIKKILPILIILIILTIPIAHSLEIYYSSPQDEQWKEVANYVKDNKKDNGVILIYPSFTSQWFEYYYKDKSEIKTINEVDKINDSIKENKSIWLVSFERNHDSKYKSELLKKELSKIYKKEITANFDGIRISHYFKKN